MYYGGCIGLVGRDVPCTSQNKHHGLEIILLLSVLQIRFKIKFDQIDTNNLVKRL